jgi:hypothetical protein
VTFYEVVNQSTLQPATTKATTDKKNVFLLVNFSIEGIDSAQFKFKNNDDLVLVNQQGSIFQAMGKCLPYFNKDMGLAFAWTRLSGCGFPVKNNKLEEEALFVVPVDALTGIGIRYMEKTFPLKLSEKR